MPYIKRQERTELDPMIKPLVDWLRAKSATEVVGFLNYVFTKIVISLWVNCRSYHMGNSIVGAFECASREFSRRWLDQYEDEKIDSNGDVFPFPKQVPTVAFKKPAYPHALPEGTTVQNHTDHKRYMVVNGYHPSDVLHGRKIILLPLDSHPSISFLADANCIGNDYRVIH
ncbi:MAG: hypothetical protein WC052_04735 [Patescibacteria group bacterium]|jgi:hypothetical protein